MATGDNQPLVTARGRGIRSLSASPRSFLAAGDTTFNGCRGGEPVGVGSPVASRGAAGPLVFRHRPIATIGVIAASRVAAAA